MKKLSTPRLKSRMRTSVFAGAAACALLFGATVPAQAAAPIPEGNMATSVFNYAFAPDSLAGGNDWGCKPSAAHPNPVILVPGTFYNEGGSFIRIAPRLKNAGYCVFSLNYGFTDASLGRMSGLAPINTSVAQLSTFVDKVRSATGAAKVDMVGWSQGGLLPIAYIKEDGGASKVAHYVGWAQSSNGTTASGLNSVITAMATLGFIPPNFAVLTSQGLQDQFVGSAFINKLKSIPLPAGPKYTSIVSSHDELLTPYTNAILPAPAQNVRLQDYCAFDLTGHVGMIVDNPTMQFTMNALNDGPSNFTPSCTGFGTPFL